MPVGGRDVHVFSVKGQIALFVVQAAGNAVDRQCVVCRDGDGIVVHGVGTGSIHTVFVSADIDVFPGNVECVIAIGIGAVTVAVEMDGFPCRQREIRVCPRNMVGQQIDRSPFRDTGIDADVFGFDRHLWGGTGVSGLQADTAQDVGDGKIATVFDGNRGGFLNVESCLRCRVYRKRLVIDGQFATTVHHESGFVVSFRSVADVEMTV